MRSDIVETGFMRQSWADFGPRTTMQNDIKFSWWLERPVPVVVLISLFYGVEARITSLFSDIVLTPSIELS
jgi:hypothetical protein